MKKLILTALLLTMKYACTTFDTKGRNVSVNDSDPQIR